MTREEKTTLQMLVQKWTALIAAIGKLNSGVTVRPVDGWTNFKPVVGGTGEFELKPVVFKLPERVRPSVRSSLLSQVTLNLYVVVDGTISVRRDDGDHKVLVTQGFKTQVAYFRESRGKLSHVYGAHCDFALNEIGHPVFHSQLRSFAEHSRHVRENYNGVGVNEAKDLVNGLLQNVRIPTAQMDVFSVFLQLCADHLVGKSSGEQERQVFDELVKENRFLRGAASQVPQMASPVAASCYRANHWYQVP